MYIAAELAGAAMAAGLFRVVRPAAFEEASKDAFKAGLSAPEAEQWAVAWRQQQRAQCRARLPRRIAG